VTQLPRLIAMMLLKNTRFWLWRVCSWRRSVGVVVRFKSLLDLSFSNTIFWFYTQLNQQQLTHGERLVSSGTPLPYRGFVVEILDLWLSNSILYYFRTNGLGNFGLHRIHSPATPPELGGSASHGLLVDLPCTDL